MRHKLKQYENRWGVFYGTFFRAYNKQQKKTFTVIKSITDSLGNPLTDHVRYKKNITKGIEGKRMRFEGIVYQYKKGKSEVDYNFREIVF